jgi:toxin-antitoxin system PIN domain toxin
MIKLLDANILIALNVGDHVHNEAATAWFTSHDDDFATCPVTEGALVRHLMRADWNAFDAANLVKIMSSSTRHKFWPDDISYGEIDMYAVAGHRQTTDAYLAALARRHKSRIATFDKGLAGLHKDVAELVPTS